MDKDEMLNYAQFDQIKEMLFCVDGLSCSDNELVSLINSHGGLYKYFEKVKSRYVEFLQKKISN